MSELKLDTALIILNTALSTAADKKLNPLAVAVLDARGCIKAAVAQDGTSLLRNDIAHGKAYGALALGIGSRAIFKRANEQPYFVDAVNTLARGAIVPVPGGVLIKDASGALVGAIGISGDTSDNDEACAVAGIAAAGLTAVTG
ncbi:heme-binding protein [Bradyrhizobium sp. U87765 SZCCT0131]|uniref:GlcG/HbpS family heme-binding protein n=1 Tax=unclassified Bradyrhizobium TaxID=2631580 RepID=UPI001BA90F05|nr:MULTISPECIES: heme-binding protein [unclassified Bradyrhizobium]MBR1221333.1 heme-binding protein [Bradyrhizobium sp. U87765 SZCCT0131]MBR1264744.1 heme-binding protein [Bradyrhizobium sp. U87765 SZCCT0134]MBR1304350.1 heme-binding protein [Bradyrhizobium sp. U87765 SZCCT0110]MBR1322793.1 heme-binding protein [Bradyrhizobium sp. U87765 SZCCT0109]MBR1346279.1 heme-binding protein [Bradyrhizobium sp. U87765 SZCCT0048]